MRILSLYSNRAPAVIGSVCVAFAACLTGCASKNPLIDETVSTSAKSSTATQETAANGVQTTKRKRFLGFISPYRVDIQQGNFASHEMVAQLKEGMTPDQVRFVMGTPLLTDIFHKDRWDYPFLLEKANGETIRSHVAVFFKDNRLARIEGGDNLPTENAYLSLIAGKPVQTKSSSPANSPTTQTSTPASDSNSSTNK
jgi:outer membrane protein assembly factor BamE